MFSQQRVFSLSNKNVRLSFIFATILLAFLIGSGSLQNAFAVDIWVAPTSGTWKDIHGVDFANNNTGWAVGDDGTMLKTTDGGINWVTLTSANEWYFYRDIDFINTAMGWVVGSHGSIQKTTDGGTSWVEQTTSISSYFYSVDFVDHLTGWAVGESGKIFKTADGGTNWVEQTSGISRTLWGVDFVDANNGWAVASGGIVLNTTNGGTTWVEKTSPTPFTLNDVKFVNTTTGWAVGSFGRIFKTTNGGTTWAEQTSNTPQHLYDVDFYGANTGWAVGSAGAIVKTSDGGANWAVQTSGTSNTLRGLKAHTDNSWAVGESGTIRMTTIDNSNWGTQTSWTAAQLESVDFANATAGLAVGYWGTILKTVNGGGWVAQTSGTSRALFGVQLADINNGWAVGDNGTILKTTDGGTTWGAQISGTDRSLRGVHFLNAGMGWVVGASTTILKTTDGGTTWVPQTSGTAANLQSVHFVNGTTGWAVGYMGKILKTTDGGTTWVPQTSGTSSPLYGVNFVSTTTGWIAGGNGLILKTTDGGATWLPQTSWTSNSLNDIKFLNGSVGWAVGNGGTILRTSNGGSRWVRQTSGTSARLSSLHAAVANTWLVGGSGTILARIYVDGIPPTTTLGTSPLNPNGSNGWFKTIPTVTLTSNEPGVTRMHWGSTPPPIGSPSWVSVSSSFPVPVGTNTLHYYSDDANNNLETIKSRQFKVDTGPPSTPLLISPDNSVPTLVTSFPNFSWSAANDPISGIDKYGLYIDSVLNREVSAPTTSTTPLSGLNAGLYSWKIRAINTAGNYSDSLSRSFIIDSVPFALFTATPNPATTDETVTLDASSSYHTDLAKTITAYEWDLDDDGSYDDATGQVVEDDITSGRHDVSLKVTDDNVPSKTDTMTLEVVVNDAPIADAGNNRIIAVGEDVLLDGGLSVEPNADTSDSIVSYEWDIIDNGSFDISTALSAKAASWAELNSFGISTTGTYDVRLKATDSFGSSSTDVTKITVTSNPGDTPAGSDTVTMSLSASVTVTFTEITSEGSTTVEVYDKKPPGPPSSFEILGQIIDIKTTASYIAPIFIEIAYDENNLFDKHGDPIAEETLVLQHWVDPPASPPETNGWNNITLYVDTDRNVIVGKAYSLSPFVKGASVVPATGLNLILLTIISMAAILLGGTALLKRRWFTSVFFVFLIK